MSEKKEIVLRSSKDWDVWISIVKTKAISYEIWDLIDPSITTKPSGFTKPTEPDLEAQQGNNFDEKHARYKIAMARHKQQMKEYEKRRESITKITDFILDTVSASNFAHIQHVDVHPWNLLQALKARIAPTDSARSLDLEHQYHRLIKGPSRQGIDQWLDDFLKMYTLAKEAGIAEAVDGKRVYRDFLLAIEKVAPNFSEMRVLLLDSITDHHATLITAIDQFRQHIRLKEAQKGKTTASNSAFAADESKGGGNSEESTYKGDSQPKPICLCGMKHRYNKCFYLNKDIRRSGWKPQEHVQQKIDDILKNNNKKREQVERALAWYRNNESKSQSTSRNPSTSRNDSTLKTPNEDTQVGSFPAQFAPAAFYNNNDYYLRSSWILDHGSGVHVANNTMKHRFIKESDCTDGSSILSGHGPLPIKAYGRISINVQTPSGKSTMTLLNVCYVPDYMINLVSGSILEDKDLHFDTFHRHLHRGGTPVVEVHRSGGHYLLENNIHQSQRVFTASKRSGTTLEWHQLMAHANNEAIQHLPANAEGVSFSDAKEAPKTNKCEDCALSKAHRIISRSSDKSESSNKPFFRITYDLIDMSTAMNNDEWISHVACSETNFQMVYTHQRKSEATDIVIRAINTIETRYNGKVVFFRSDGEPSLGKSFDTFLATKGITFEPSASDTPAQNGHSERLGGILVMKARAMRIQANLPSNLWPWVVQTTGYIMNRTPSKRLGWKTPFEKATNQKPNLSHIIQYGSKAYPIDKHIPKREKLKPRAHIGFLVGYASTNIFLIWIPSKDKVVRTRDVTFNEEKRYRPNEIDLAQLLTEPFIQDNTLDIPSTDLTHLIGETSSESENEDELFEAPTGSIIEKRQDLSKDVEDIEDVRGYLPSPAPTSSRGDTPGTPQLHTESSNSSTEPIDTPPSRSESPSYQSQEAQLQSQLQESITHPNRDEDQSNRPEFSSHNRSMLRNEDILPEGSKRVRKPNRRREAYYTAMEEASRGGVFSFNGSFMTSIQKDKRPHRDELPSEPKYFHQLMKHPEAKGFLKAIDVEINALQLKGTWRVVSYQHAKEAKKVPIPTTWVFKYKFDNEGYLLKHKARLCARGDLQHTEQDVYAATLAIKVFRALMAIVTAFNLNTRQYDAVNAFANSEIDEPTYCKPPDGWKGTSNELLLLLRALYGLKQSPALWYKHLSNTLNDLGLEQIPGIECVFTCNYMILFFFVDDIAVLYHPRYSKEVDAFEHRLFQKYEMRNMGEIEWFLGIRITRNRDIHQTSLCQDSYIDKLMSKFNINTTNKNPGSPLNNYIAMTKNLDTASPQSILMYQQRVGSVNFAAVTTRPDVAFAASKLSEFLTNPSNYHMEQADRVLQYLAHTKHYGIVFDGQALNPDTVFLGSSDASFADDPDTRKSSNGYCFRLFNGIIDWKASKQKTVTTSSTEAELLALSLAGNTKMWWDRFFKAIDMNIGGTTHIQCDNRQTIRALKTPGSKFTTKLRHVDIHRHWLRQEVLQGSISIEWTPTTRILADGLTKALPPQRHKEFVKLIGLEEIPIKETPQKHQTNANLGVIHGMDNS